MKKLLSGLGIVLALGVGACASDGENGTNGLIVSADEPAGDNCADGGLKITTGGDINGNGMLEEDEISATRYVCGGATGANGMNGPTSLVQTNAEPAGANCPNGGQMVQHGVDDNRDGMLDAAEVDGTSYVCHGANGVAGMNGSDGNNALVETTPEPAGMNCDDGGIRVDGGVDVNGNGMLDAEESTSTSYVCNGTNRNAGFQIFTENGVFSPPVGVSNVRVLMVGGGGSGCGSHYRGGGSGHVVVAQTAVAGDVNIAVGAGGARSDGAGNGFDGKNGETSRFGALSAAGGTGGGDFNGSGNGGSGGGGAGNAGSGGDGGTAGANGMPGQSYPGGVGGNFDDLSSFVHASIVAGAGGTTGMSSNSGGGGGGGVVIEMSNVRGEDGLHMTYSAKGGEGYGAGGGSGGYEHSLPNGSRYAIGGAGANGVVYVEWD